MNPELFMNQYMTPIYISTTNMVAPIANIPLVSLYENVVEFATFAWQTIAIIAYTFAFIAKEALIALNNYLSFTEKILLALCIYNFISQLVLEFGSIDKQLKLQEKFETTEKQMNCLRTSESMRENWEQMWAEEIRNMHNENDKKFKDIEKEMSMYKEALDEQTNIINEHQQNEQIIFQKMAQLSKELKKMKKEMEKYA
jgi:hypothetical protein